ncbi:MAG: hypothetical protein RSE10_09440, partial [Oscillospiraceae bacterium]
EFAEGASTAASVGMYSGTANASYNNNDKTFTLTSNGGVIGWAKLEKGSAATPYVAKGYGAELLECQRYFQIIGKGLNIYIPFIGGTQYYLYLQWFVQMRAIPTIAYITASGNVASYQVTATGANLYGGTFANPTAQIIIKDVVVSADL